MPYNQKKSGHFCSRLLSGLPNHTGRGGLSLKTPLAPNRYLEDHPMTCKWLITMVIVVVPKTWGYSPSKWAKWFVNGGY